MRELNSKILSMKAWLTLTAALCTASLFAQTIDLDHFEAMKPRSVGPAGMSGRVTSIDVVLTNPDVMYVGTASGGLWRSKSGGVSWEPIFDDQPVQSIGAVAIQQSNPDVIWAGSGEGNPRNSQTSGGGIFKSIDGGENWTMMGLEATKTIHRIIIHRDNPDLVFVAAMGSAWGPNEERGVYRTKDGGKTWDKILYNNDLTGCADLVVDPTNPNKMIAGMWEYQRWPWFFESGGEGSGMYITFDGGDNWEKRTDEDGLPKGKLGRMGLAIAPSKPNVVYALIEANKLALYRSDDGGFKWHKVSDKDVGNRPFYYADIYVDSKNENRVYNLWSFLSRSEDGGKTFKIIMPYSYHPDHHAFWIHPDDPNFVMEGNDGGLHISRDGAKTWRFVENLPLAQFYHINIDDDIPYNIYGGMQDNGSWIGPAYSWRNGGIRNNDWQEVNFGDGFDVMPKKGDNRYGYAMYQGGNVSVYDKETGAHQNIQPMHPDGLPLRFNWNAGIAQNPFHNDGIYFGSQFLHKSMDCGSSWEIISPDLTTNDTTKQKQAESGGLTIDATRAENYTSILSIAPSPLDEQVIWVGTDDGNLQLTRDGGANWTNLASKLKDLPAGSWIPQITASSHKAGEAFVIANNYRRNDWKPYAYKTTDFGKTWTRLAGPDQVSGYCLSMVQDPVAANLLFLGTENGLYYSLDGGSKWDLWDQGYPTVSTMDLKIHPREHDLIMGTFGRAAWVMDNILPLRELAQKGVELLDEDFAVFRSPDAYLANYSAAAGVRFTGDAHFRGANKRRGAVLTYWIKPKDEEKSDDKDKPKDDEPKVEDKDKKKDDGKVHLYVLDAAGDTIRRWTRDPKDGLNRITWFMNQDGFRYPSWGEVKEDADPPNGRSVVPGTYTVHITYKEGSGQTTVKVLGDPRLPVTQADYEAQAAYAAEHQKVVTTATEMFNQLKEARKVVKHVNTQLEFAEEAVKDSLTKDGKAITDTIMAMMHMYMTPQDFVGYDHVTERLNTHLYNANGYFSVSPVKGGVSPTAKVAIAKADKAMQAVHVRFTRFMETDWKAYRAKVEEASLTPFKDFEAVPLDR